MATEQPGRWSTGADEIDTYLDSGELERVSPSKEHAALLIGQATKHLESAELLVEQDPPAAFALTYDAARKAMTAILARQGLRPTSKGGHRVVQDAIEAQLGPNARRVVRPFRDLRTRRHESEYPQLGQAPVTVDETRRAHADATGIVSAMTKVLPRVGPF